MSDIEKGLSLSNFFDGLKSFSFHQDENASGYLALS